MTAAHLFETAMLLFFSLGWCTSIATMACTRRPVEKPVVFVALTGAGYLMGILSKLAGWHATGLLSPVIWVYLWNAGMILTDMMLVHALVRPRPGLAHPVR